MVRSEETAEDSFAAILARSKLGMAMAAMIRIIATTISNSIREKPRCLPIGLVTKNPLHRVLAAAYTRNQSTQDAKEKPSVHSVLGSRTSNDSACTAKPKPFPGYGVVRSESHA